MEIWENWEAPNTKGKKKWNQFINNHNLSLQPKDRRYKYNYYNIFLNWKNIEYKKVCCVVGKMNVSLCESFQKVLTLLRGKHMNIRWRIRANHVCLSDIILSTCNFSKPNLLQFVIKNPINIYIYMLYYINYLIFFLHWLHTYSIINLMVDHKHW